MDLRDNIRLNTEVDLEALAKLVQEFKDLKINVSGVAAVSRALSEQMKLSALESANATKQATLEFNKQAAEIKKVSNELIAEEKISQQLYNTSTSQSRAKVATIQAELLARKNLIDSLISEDKVSQQLSFTSIAASNAKRAALNAELTAARTLTAEEKIAEQIERTQIAQKNNATAAIKTQTAEIQKEREGVRLNTEQQRLYNAQLRNKALEAREAQKANDGLFTSLNSLTKIRSELITLFGAYSLGSFAEQMIDAQSKVQAFELSMKNLLGGAYGSKLVADLKQFTVQTPLNFEEVIGATNTLVGSFKAAGASSKTIGIEIPQILESLGNSAAALGGENRLGRLIYAFSQVQATGRLMGTEVRQITETGFPLLAVLTDSLNQRFPKLSLSIADVQKRISDGKVSFDDFKIALLSAGEAGGVFAGSMDIMANTVRGRIDKLKESTFFALANIGNQFNDTAKIAIDFGASLVNSLFGTESATRRTIDLLKTAIATWGAYTIATRLAASQTVINTAIDRASLILRGQLILANASLTGSYNVLTAAETEAAVAARAFNTTAISNPLGLLVLGIGAVVGGYQLYKNSVEEAQIAQNKQNEQIANAIAPLKTQQQEFHNLADAVLSTKLPLSEQQKILEKLKLEYPLLLKGVNDLSTAEDILNKNKIKTNATLDFRNSKFEELKRKYPEQLKGIDTLAEAELKLGAIVRSTDRDFAILSATMENNIRVQNQVAGANENFAKKIQAQAELAKLRAGQTGANLVDFGGNIINNTPALIAAKEREIASYDKAAKEFVKSAEVIMAKNEELTSKLKYNWDEIPKTIEKTGKEGKEKALKYQEQTNRERLLLDQINSLKEQQQTRENQEQILELEKTYDELRVINAKGSQSKKSQEMIKINTKYREDLANLTREWDKKDIEASEKFWKEVAKKEEDTQENRVKFSKAIDKILEDAKDESEKNKVKIAEKYSKDLQKIDEDNLKESNKLLNKKYELMDSLRLLNRVSQAKTSQEIVDIQKEENIKVLTEIKESIRQELILSKLRLERLKQEKGEGSLEYKQFFNNVLKLEGDYTDASTKLTNEQTEQKKKNIKKIEEITKESLTIIYEFGKNVLSDVFSIKEERLSQQLSKAETELDKFRIRQQQKDLETEKKTISFFTSLASGNWVQALGSLVSVIGDLSRNDSLERQAALLKDQLNSLKEIMGIIDSSLNSIGSSFENISSIYGSIFDTSKLQAFTDLANKSIEDRIQAEIKHGQQIIDNYNKAVREENDRYNKEVENINNVFNLEVKNINAKYDLIDQKAKQAYNAETLAITTAGTAQLEALIKNEESLSSVRAEFAQKRLEIENAFPLANKAITEGMSQAEIDAINSSIDARDKAFAKLQEKYNQELINIANSEGQKRKEYSETEKIQNEINAKLELAAIKFQADEIQRTKDKADAIIVAEQSKNTSIQIETEKHNQVLVDLEMKKNLAILNSFSDLKLLLQAQIYQITGALVDSANISAEAFAKLKQQLEEITNLYRALSNGTNPPTITIPTINIPRIPTGFEKGTDNTSVSLAGQRVVDNKGGWTAILHPQEAVFSKADMSQMETVFGKRPTRQEVIETFKLGVINQTMPQINPYVIQKMQANGVGNFDKLSSEIRGLAKEVSKKMTPVVYMDKGGVRVFYKNLNTQIEVKNQRFR